MRCSGRASKCRPATDQRGVSLIELLVVMVILGVVGGITTAAITTAIRSSSATSARLEATNELRIAMQRMTRDFRTAEAFVFDLDDADLDLATELSIDIDTAQDSERIVTYRVTGSPGQRGLQREDGGASTLVTALGNAAGEPVFVYLNRAGEIINCEVQGTGVCARASQVQITLVRDLPGDRSPIVLESTVFLRNTRFRG